MTDDRELARRLFGTLLKDEPPLRTRVPDLVAAGARRRSRVAGGSALAAAAGVTAVLVLAAAPGPGPDTAAAPAGVPTTGRPIMGATPPPPVQPVPAEDLVQPPGATDILTPAREQELMRVNNEAFRQTYAAPPGWRLTTRVSFVDDPGISDEAWNGGAEVTDTRGRVATVLVALNQRPPGSAAGPACLAARERLAVPGRGTVTVDRSDGLVRVCHDRGAGLVVSALVTSGRFGPALRPAAVPELPATPEQLARLATDPRFRWPAG